MRAAALPSRPEGERRREPGPGEGRALPWRRAGGGPRPSPGLAALSFLPRSRAEPSRAAAAPTKPPPWPAPPCPGWFTTASGAAARAPPAPAARSSRRPTRRTCASSTRPGSAWSGTCAARWAPSAAWSRSTWRRCRTLASKVRGRRAPSPSPRRGGEGPAPGASAGREGAAMRPVLPEPPPSPTVSSAAFKPVDLGDLKRRNTQDAKKS